ncbi:DUF4148 domain-containing protein [Robbsia sp. Bb-Pol-6]|uniref:DUF4148 domain-containing protein n=1 Tax=Robbsia betulipollinis TaxID=2981849 RepID=A0ABT3ZQ11_9BURK|nr:DUF4148 domain-containing protein [Robbsia betulipollinis]MCY0387978.1 DUF4148 domain-containing protein [Robbsia betulipollinis]
MFNSKKRTVASLLFAAALGCGIASPAFSQTPTADTSSAASMDSGSTKAETHAQRKADGKARRARKNAELRKLEKAGYNPSANDPDYPNDLQKAEKKANGQ